MEQRTGSKTGKGVRQGCVLSPCLFNLYAEYIMQNIGLDEAQIGTKTAKIFSYSFFQKVYHFKHLDF